ncbi:DUF4435 domain-containing protein [Flavobacterium filum]|uniref:DUF4435 domain-containing protein n=1 Tax=Flavobacterium filum TaxID=370974 RepID=UPI0023F4DE01|nr:DUF4435 domain-containing protein [Flavobacterium filum]
MTNFTRTKEGLENQASFYNKEFVMFVEGGDIQDTNKDKVKTFDEYFWERLVAIYQFDKNVHIRSVGSKTNLIKYIEEIERGTNNLLVGCDRDYDQILNKLIKNKRVIYTYGYSWENDVFQLNVALETIKSLTIQPIHPDSLKEFNENIDAFYKQLSQVVNHDIYLIHEKSDSSFIDREKPCSLLDLNSDLPKLCPTKIESKVKQKGIDKNNLKKLESMLPLMHIKWICVGHLLEAFFTESLKAFMKNKVKTAKGKFSVSKEVLYKSFIDLYFDRFYHGSESKPYYSDCFNKLKV